MKTEVKKALSILAISVGFLLQFPGPIQHWALPAKILAEAFLVALHIPLQVQILVGFGFSNAIPACSVSLYSSQVTCLYSHLLLCFLYMSEFCQELLVHPHRPPATFV